MKRQVKVSKLVFIAGALATIVAVAATPLRAQSDSTVKALEQTSTVDKKKKNQDRRATLSGMPQSNVIGARPRSGTEVPARCEDARALAAQIVSGGPTDKMVYNPRLGSLDASRGLEAAPFEARMTPRNPRQIEAMNNGTYRRNGGEGEIAKSMRSMQMPSHPTERTPHC